jgi:hypothetical protein
MRQKRNCSLWWLRSCRFELWHLKAAPGTVDTCGVVVDVLLGVEAIFGRINWLVSRLPESVDGFVATKNWRSLKKLAGTILSENRVVVTPGGHALSRI